MIDIETLPARVDTPSERTTPIRPSEAIRLGCLLAPVQSFGAYMDGEGTACASRAMHLGGLRTKADFDAVGWRRLGCPVEDHPSPGNVMAHLNDDHRWTREAIADWLESVGF